MSHRSGGEAGNAGSHSNASKNDVQEMKPCVSHACKCCRLLLLDVIYNNARSKIAIASIFVLISSVLSYYIVTQVILDIRDPSATIGWLTKPPSEAFFGFPFEPFKARITDEYGRGIEDVRVVAKLFPKQAYRITAPINDGMGTSAQGRTIDCVTYLTYPLLSASPLDDAPMCNPVGWQLQDRKETQENGIASGDNDDPMSLVTGFESITDGDGIAHFDKLTLYYGFPVTYAVHVSHSLPDDRTGRNIRYASASTLLGSFVKKIRISKKPPAQVAMHESFSLVATAYLHIKDNRNITSTEDGNQSILLRQLSLSRFSPTLYTQDEIHATLCGLVAVVFSTPFENMVNSESQNAAFLSGNVRKLANISVRSETDEATTAEHGVAASSDLPRHVAMLTFSFPNLRFESTMFSRQFLVVFVAGSTAIVPVPTAQAFEFRRPKYIPEPIHVKSPAYSIQLYEISKARLPQDLSGNATGTFSIGEKPAFRVREGSPFSVRFRVIAQNGSGIVGHRCFVYYGPVSLSAKQVGNIGPKTLAGVISSITDENGTGVFEDSVFSSVGFIGQYFFTARSNEDGYFAKGTTSDPVILIVDSSLNISAVSPYMSLPDNDTDEFVSVRVGVPWSIRPIARVITESGAGASGKVADIQRVAGPGQVALKVTPRVSGIDGYLGFDEVIVQAATNFGTYTFCLSIDGLVAPTNFSVNVLEPLDSMEGSCAAFRPFFDDSLGGTEQRVGTYLRAMRFLAVDDRGNPSNLFSTGVRVEVVSNGIQFITPTGISASTDWLTPEVGQEYPYSLSDYAFWLEPDGSSGFRALPVTLAVQCTSNVSDPLSSLNEVMTFTAITFARLGTAFVNRGFEKNADDSYSAQLILIDLQVMAEFDIPSFSLPVFLELVQQSRFVSDYVTFMGAFDAFNQSAWLIEDTREKRVASLWLTIRPLHDGIAGFFRFKIVADGLTLPQTLELEVAPKVAQIELIRSLGQSGVSAGVPFTTQPELRVTDASGVPVPNVIIIAELAAVHANSTDTNITDEDFLWPVSQHRDLLLAALGDLGLQGPGIPVSIPSDSDGYTRFRRLGFLGAAPDMRYYIRYVVARLPAEQDGNMTLIAAQDPSVLTSSSSVSAVTLLFVQSPPKFAVPGVPLSQSVQISALVEGGMPFLGGVAKLMVNGTLSNSDESDDYENPLSFPTLETFIPSLGGVFSVPELTFSEDAPLGEYNLKLMLPGGTSIVSSTVRVTSAASKVLFVDKPPTSAIIGQSIHASVSVIIADGTPLPNAIVAVTLSAVDATGQSVPVSSCVYDACGTLDGASARATTNSSGAATFAILVKSGQSGLYRLRFGVESTTASLIERVAGIVSAGNGLLTGAQDIMAAQSALELDQSMVEGAAAATGVEGAAAGVEDAATATESVGPLAGILKGSMDEEAKEFARQEVRSQINGDEALATLVTSAVFQTLSAETSVAVLSDIMYLRNDVASVSIAIQPELGTSQDFVIQAAGTVFFKQQPVIRVVDAAGRPLSRRTVSVSLVPSKRNFYCEELTMTGLDGVFAFTELRMGTGEVGTFHLIFAVDGIASAASASFEIEELGISTETLIYIMSAGLVVILMPVFFSVVPFTPGYCVFLSFGMLALFIVVLTVFRFAQELFFITSSVYIIIQLAVMIGSFTVLVIAMIVVAVIYVAEQRSTKPITERLLDDQPRPTLWYNYTRWFISVRRPFRPQNEWEAIMQEEEAKTLSGRLSAAFKGMCSGEKNDANTNQQQPKLRGDGGVAHDLYQGHFIPPEIPLPDDMPFPTQYPIKMWIALSVSFVLLIASVTTVLWMIEIFGAQLKTFVLHFPSPPQGLSTAEREQFNSELQSSIVFGLNLLSQAVPAVSALGQFEESIRQFDLLTGWETLHSVLSDFQYVVYNNAIGATVVACLVVVLTWVFMLINTKSLMKKIRRGELRTMRSDAMLAEADRYIGLQCGHILISFFLVFIVFFFLLMVLSSSYLVSKILDALLGAVLASLASTIATILLEYLVVRTILTAGLVIIYLHPYTWWTLCAVLVSVLNGLIQTLVRLVQAIFSMILLFARLDLDIFPQKLLFMDVGYRAFYSMLHADEEYNNPIFITCAAVMAAESAMMCNAKEHAEEPLPSTLVQIESIIQERIQLPQMRTLALLHLQDLLRPKQLDSPTTSPDDSRIDMKKLSVLCDCSEKTLRLRKIQSRWRLAALLELNPSLRKLRMIVDSEVEANEDGKDVDKEIKEPPECTQKAAAAIPSTTATTSSGVADAAAAPAMQQWLTNGDWAFDESSGLFWSQQQFLYLDTHTNHFYDPRSEMWYDPQSDHWYDTNATE